MCHVKRVLRRWTVCCVLCAVGSLPLVVRAETLRDPFVFGPREGGVAEASGTVLIGVLWDATHPLAIVGEQPVGIGDRVADWEVVAIQPNGITVQRGDRREFVTPGNSLPTE